MPLMCGYFYIIWGWGSLGDVLPFLDKALDQGVATLCTVVFLAGMGWHFIKLKPTLDAQNQLIINNTLATQALVDSARANAAIFDKVSDKLIAHDERTLNLQQHISVFADGISHIKTNMVTLESNNRMHERIDKTADKTDMALVHNRLEKMEEDVQGISLQVTKIAGKVGC